MIYFKFIKGESNKAYGMIDISLHILPIPNSPFIFKPQV